MKRIIILAMHGAPPNDFPPRELAEFFSLHSRVGHEHGAGKTPAVDRYHELEKKIRKWPRTHANDPFYSASQELAGHLGRETGNEVLVGYNEFCSPELSEVLVEAARMHADEVVVVTPMMTRGGEHAEKDIPAVVENIRTLYPSMRVVYAWPFAVTDVARFLAEQIKRFV